MDANMFGNLVINFVANLASAALLGLVVAVFVFARRRRGMRRFFGFPPGRTSVRLYLSTIAVRPTGTVGTSPIVDGYYGDAITELEYRHSLNLAARIANGSPSWLVDLLQGPRANAGRITSYVQLSLPYRGQDGSGTIEEHVAHSEADVYQRLQRSSCAILVGSPVYNLMTYHVMRKNARFFGDIREQRGDTAVRGIRELQGPDTGGEHLRQEDHVNEEFVDYFVIEKLLVAKTTVFVCAGTCAAATAAALDKLRDWPHYLHQYGTESFGELYEIKTSMPAGRDSEPTTRVRQLRTYPER